MISKILYLQFCVVCIAPFESLTRYKKCTVLKGLKLDKCYKTIFLNSLLKCAVHCQNDDACLSANYNKIEKTCELCMENPRMETSIIVEDVTWNLLYIEDGTWQMVFRGSTGIGVHLYPAFKGTISLSTPEVGCRLTHTLTCSTHYRSPIIDSWQTQNIHQVKFAMYKQNYMVVNLIFNNLNNDTNEDWFSKDRLVNSSYTDLTSANQQFNYFSIFGRDVRTRRFYINQAFQGCSNDYGWVAVLDDPSKAVCNYEIGLKNPYFAYIPNNVVGNWETRQSADVLAIFIQRG